MEWRVSMNKKNCILVFVLFFLVSCSKSGEEKQKLLQEVSVPVIKLEKKLQADVYETTGTLKSIKSISIPTRISGFVKAVNVSAGDKVKRGQLLIQIDDSSLIAARDEAQANFNLAESTHERYKQLLEKKSVSQQEFDEVEARYKLSSAALKNALSNLSYSRIVSPIDGVVTTKSVEAGDMVNLGTLLLRLDETSIYRVEAVVEEDQIANIKIGDEARVRISAYDKKLKAKIVEIVPEVDEATRSFIVKLEPDFSELEDLELRSGMHSKVCMKIGEKEIISIPETALIKRGQLDYVYILDENDRAKLRLVKLGKYIAENLDQDGSLSLGSYEILSGIEETERVVSDGTALINEGDKINVQ
jgi:RND family efflux transporter MFP subunit